MAPAGTQSTRQTRTRLTLSSQPSASKTTDSSPTARAKETLRTFLDRWVEPPLRTPVPSFVDHGLERQGVLENMMPLGTFPTAKVKARARGVAGGNPQRQTVQARHLKGLVPEDEHATPQRSFRSDETPATDDPAEDSTNVEEAEEWTLPSTEIKVARRATPERVSRSSSLSATSASRNSTPSLDSKEMITSATIPPIEAARPFAKALDMTVTRSQHGLAKYVRLAHRFAHEDAEFDRILTAFASTPEHGRSQDLEDAYKHKVKEIRRVLRAERSISSGRKSIDRSAAPLSKSSPETSSRTIAPATRYSTRKSTSLKAAFSTTTSPTLHQTSSPPLSPLKKPAPLRIKLTSSSNFLANGVDNMASKKKSAKKAPPVAKSPRKAQSKPSSEKQNSEKADRKDTSPSDNVVAPSDRTSSLSSIDENVITTPPPTLDAGRRLTRSSRTSLSQPLSEAPAKRASTQNIDSSPLPAVAGTKRSSTEALSTQDGDVTDEPKRKRAKSAKAVAASSQEEETLHEIEQKRAKKPLPKKLILKARPEVEETDEIQKFQEQEEARRDKYRKQHGLQSGKKRKADDPPSLLTESDEEREVVKARLRKKDGYMEEVDSKPSNIRPKRRRREETPPAEVPPMASSNGEGPSRDVSELLTPPKNLPNPFTHDGPEVRRTPAKGERKAAKARTILSPIKSDAMVAGMAQLAKRRNGPSGRDDEAEHSDHVDVCSSCGGRGYLICCDGCDRAFHFTCVDPPLDQDAENAETWFCSRCASTKALPAQPLQPQSTGLFSALLQNIEKKNPTAFALPKEIRDYFEGVTTGLQGQYVDVGEARVNNRARGTGHIEFDDFKRLKDSKGNLITCWSCKKSSAGVREIITCDACGKHWHLDCLNPPLSQPPHRGQRDRRAWICPLHIEHDLRQLQDRHGRLFRARRPKKAKTIEPGFRRHNNGNIEIEDVSSSDDDFESKADLDGTVHRLPPVGVQLEFINKVHRNRSASARIRTSATTTSPAKNPVDSQSSTKSETMKQTVSSDKLDKYTADERQAIAHLIEMATMSPDPKLGPERIVQLIDELKTAASGESKTGTDSDKSLVNGDLQSPPEKNEDKVLKEERDELLKLQELIKRKLEAMDKN